MPQHSVSRMYHQIIFLIAITFGRNNNEISLRIIHKLTLLSNAKEHPPSDRFPLFVYHMSKINLPLEKVMSYLRHSPGLKDEFV